MNNESIHSQNYGLVKAHITMKPKEMGNTYRQYCKHHLRHIEGMTPVVIQNFSIILFHREQPPTQDIVLNIEPLHQIQIQEHSQTSLKRKQQKKPHTYTCTLIKQNCSFLCGISSKNHLGNEIGKRAHNNYTGPKTERTFTLKVS